MAKQQGYQPQPGNRPAATATGSGVSVAVEKPALGLPVIVITSEKISGQNEHAAIITQIHSDDVVNVMVMPGSGQPYPISSIHHTRLSMPGALSWHFPPVQART